MASDFWRQASNYFVRDQLAESGVGAGRLSYHYTCWRLRLVLIFKSLIFSQEKKRSYSSDSRALGKVLESAEFTTLISNLLWALIPTFMSKKLINRIRWLTLSNPCREIEEDATIRTIPCHLFRKNWNSKVAFLGALFALLVILCSKINIESLNLNGSENSCCYVHLYKKAVHMF